MLFNNYNSMPPKNEETEITALGCPLTQIV